MPAVLQLADFGPGCRNALIPVPAPDLADAQNRPDRHAFRPVRPRRHPDQARARFLPARPRCQDHPDRRQSENFQYREDRPPSNPFSVKHGTG